MAGGHVENELYEAAYAALEGVASQNLRSVGIPAISSGVYGFPIIVACRNIIEAITDFCQDARFRVVSEIHLVDPNDMTVNVFHQALCKIHGPENVILEGQPRSQPAHALAAAAAGDYAFSFATSYKYI